MSRGSCTIALAAVTAVLCTASTATAASRPACGALRGHDLAPAAGVRLVQRANGDHGRDLVGCVLPAGPVRVVAASAHGYAHDGVFKDDGYRLTQVAGATVLATVTTVREHSSSTTLQVTDLRTGRSYVLAATCGRTSAGFCSAGVPDSRRVAAVVNDRGQAAAAVLAQGTQVTTVYGWSAAGRATVLDSAPAGELPYTSLGLAGDVASWTHSGAERSAVLPA